MLINVKSLLRGLLLFYIIVINTLFSQTTEYDTLRLKAGSQVEFINNLFEVVRDTVIIVPSDLKYIIYETPDSASQEVLKNIKTYKGENKLLQLLHNSIIVERKSSDQFGNNRNFNKSFKEYVDYQGKVIKEIRHKQAHIFSGSVYDTISQAKDKKKGVLEKIHYYTRENVIKKYLTFSIGEELDPHRISDSERILRGLPFLEDAKITVIPNKADTNSVDVLVVTKDRFAWGFNVLPYSLNRIASTIYNRNVLGYGWNLQLKYSYDGRYDRPGSYNTRMDFININGWFIDAALEYDYGSDREGGGVDFSKPFVTVETKYGGGLDLKNLHSSRNYGDTLFIYYTYNYEDLWLARQISVSKRNRNKTVFIAARLARKYFTNRPYVSPDSNYYFYNENSALGSIIYSNVDYYKSRLVYGFGITEDVPVGTRLALTTGILYDDFNYFKYLGLETGYAFINKRLGYFLYSAKWGALYEHKRFEHGWMIFNARYISPLIRKGKNSFRHFIRISYAQGFKRQRDYYLYLRGDNGIRGLDLNAIKGVKRFFFSYESVMFTPLNLYGFKVSIFGFGDLGLIRNGSKNVFNSKMYSGIGLGWRIKNESLVFRTIQIRLAYYPNTADGGGMPGFNITTKDTRLFQNIFQIKPMLFDPR